MNNLKQIRQSKQLSQQQLADKIGSSKSYISELESGHIRNPSLGKARLIAYVLGVHDSEIFGDDK